MNHTEIEEVSSDITRTIADILNRRFDIPYLNEKEEEHLLIYVIDLLETKFNIHFSKLNKVNAFWVTLVIGLIISEVVMYFTKCSCE